MREVFSTPGEVRLDLRIPEGRIDIETVDGAETTVELTGPDEDELRERAEIRHREVDGVHEVRVAFEPRSGGFGFSLGSIRMEVRLEEVRLYVTVPHGAAVRAETGSADTRGRGSFGPTEVKTGSGDVAFDSAAEAAVKTGSGDVSLDCVEGDAVVSSGSGDVRIDRIGGEDVIRTASGDVELGAVARGLTIQTASGDQDIRSVTEGDVYLQSASGDIRVGVRRGSRFFIDARSMSGETTSDLDLTDMPVDDEEGGPLVELRATAMSGDIHVARA